jgi:Ala-tRNA(Pro) deacylase
MRVSGGGAGCDAWCVCLLPDCAPLAHPFCAACARMCAVREAKKNKVPKDAMMALVEQLKALKAQYEELTGEAYPVGGREKKPKQDKGGGSGGSGKGGGGGGKKKADVPTGPPKVSGQDGLLAEMKKLGITPLACVQHAPVVTVEEMMAVTAGLTGGRAKNLFLKDKKGNFYLVSALHDTDTTTKKIETHYGIKSGTLRLVADADILMGYLGVVKGQVSPFCAANDSGGKVKVVLDAHFQSFETLCFHPLDNAATMSVSTSDMLKFLQACGHEPDFFDFGEPLGAESQAFKDAPAPAVVAAQAAGSAREQRLAKLSGPPAPVPAEAILSVPLSSLQDNGVEFYVQPGTAVWVADGTSAYAGTVKGCPGDQLGLWSVQKLADDSTVDVPYQSIYPRKLFVPMPAAAPEPEAPATEEAEQQVEEEEEETRVPGLLVLPGSPQVAERKAALPPFGDGGDRVARCSGVIGELGLKVAKTKHKACIKTEEKTSNQVHHEVLPVPGHIVVTLLVKGQKKKELIMIVKKPSTKLNLKEFGKAAGVVGNAVRMADAKALDANLGVATDFVSPLALVNTLDAGVVLHKVVIDAALQDGHTIWCLPPGENTQTWGMSLLDLGKFAQGCGQNVEVVELEEGSEAAALVPPPRKSKQTVATGSDSGVSGVSLVAPANGKSAADGGCWTVRLNYGAGESDGGVCGASLVAPANGKSAADGGRWTVRLNYGAGVGIASGLQLIAPTDGKGAAEGGRWTVSIGSLLAGSGGIAGTGGAETASEPVGTGELNCGACQPWWDGEPVPESPVVTKLAEVGCSSDSAQHATVEEELASWCTSLLVKCKKSKKMFMVTTAPGNKADLKRLAKEVGAKELRLVSAEKDKAVLNLPEGCQNGCVTALSVVGTGAQACKVFISGVSPFRVSLAYCVWLSANCSVLNGQIACR